MSADIQLKVVREIKREGLFLSLVRVPGSSRLIAGAGDGLLYDFDGAAESPEFKPLSGHASFVTGVTVAESSIVSGGYDCSLIWRSLADGSELRRIPEAHARWIRKVVASPDGQRVASVGDDMICRLWDTDSGKLVHELRGHEPVTPHHFPSMLYTCAFSADGRLLATADKTGRICLWDVAGGNPVRVLEAPGFYTWDPRQRIHSIGGTRALAFSPDGKFLVAGGIGTIGNIDHLDGPARVEMFDVESGTSLHVFSGETKGLVEQLLFDSANRFLLSVGGDNGGFWQTHDLQEKKTVRSEKAPMHIYAAALSEDARHLYAAGHGRIVVAELG